MNPPNTIITLIRFAYTPWATYGNLFMPGFSCKTLERPWVGNEPFLSCIPFGLYDLEPTLWRGNYETWEVINVPDRTQIKLHPANHPNELQGCIALGYDFGQATKLGQIGWGLASGTRGCHKEFSEWMAGSVVPWSLMVENSRKNPGML